MRFLGLCSMLLFLAACTKEPVYMERKENSSSVKLAQWLKDNCPYKVVEASTGTVLYNATEIKFDSDVISQRGIFYVQADQQGFPTIKEINASGDSRDIQLGSSVNTCPNYIVSTTRITLNIESGYQKLSLTDYPVAILQHESIPQTNWKINTPAEISIKF